jgi:Carboxypeptidase regulatory-like domain
MFGLRLFARRRFVLIRFHALVPVIILIFFASNPAVAGAVQGPPAQSKTSSQKTAAASGQISGHIYRADTGAPLAKAEVVLIPVNGAGSEVEGERRYALTDANGFYTFGRVAVGTYVVHTSPHGFVSRYFDDAASPEDSRILAIGSGEGLERIDIRVVSEGVISGTVLDEDNQPLVGVPVQAVRVSYERGGHRREAPQTMVNTDDLGNFRLYRLPPGNYFVRIENTSINIHSGAQVTQVAYYPGATSIENAQPLKVTGGNEVSGIGFSVVAAPTYSVSGNIVDTSGSGGPKQYNVALMHLTGFDTAPNVASSMGGSFIIRGVTSGEYLVWATAVQTKPVVQTKGPLHEIAGFTTVRVPDSDVRANITVSYGADVSGKIILENSTGQSVNGIGIGLGNEIAGRLIIWNFLGDTTKQNGAFRITGVPSGSFDFSIWNASGMYLKKVVCNGKDFTLAPLTIESGAGASDCVVTLGTDAGVIKGWVLDGDKPVAHQLVVAIPEDRSLRSVERFTITGNTNANGEYQLSGIIPADYLLFAVAPDEDQTYFEINFADRNLRDAERVTVKSGETKTVTLKPATAQ